MKKVSLKKLALKVEKISNFDNQSIKGGSKKTALGLSETTRVGGDSVEICIPEC